MTIPITKMYYRFCIKEGIDGGASKDLVFSQSKLDLKWLRTKLRNQFGVPEDRRIFYIDDDRDHVPIDSECEFHEVLKLANIAFKMKSAIPLIVGSIDMGNEEENFIWARPLGPKTQLRNIDDKSTWNTFLNSCPGKACRGSAKPPRNPIKNPFFYSPHMQNLECDKKRYANEEVLSNQKKLRDPFKNPSYCSSQMQNLECDKKRYENEKVLSNQKKFNGKQWNELTETKVRRIDQQTESKDTDIQRESNASLQHCLDTLPPLWFTEYMESMKKDMVTSIINEVVKNVTNALNKRLDSLVFSQLKELEQFRSQYVSLATRYPQSSSDSNEENKKKINSQDKEQSNDALIERADEPQNVNTMKNIQIKKDMISTITNEVVKEVTELLDKISTDSLASVPSNPSQSRFLSHFPAPTQVPRYTLDLHSSEKNQETIRPQDKEQSSDNNSSTVKMDESSWYSNILENSTRQLQKRLDLIEDIIRSNVEGKEKEKQHPQIAQAIVNDLSRDIPREKEQSVRNNAREDLASRKNLLLQMDPNERELSDERVHLEALKLIENELRMNCSVNGHQMLDEGLLNKDIYNTVDNNLLEIEKDAKKNSTLFRMCDQEEKKENEKEEDDDAFEIIQMPTSCDELSDEFTPFEELNIEQQHHDSNRDSPSFELLSEPSSPPRSIHLNEDHFSANEEKLEQHSTITNPANSVFVVDIHGNIFEDEHHTVNSDERVNVDLKKQPGVTYSFAMDEDPLIENVGEETHSSKSSCAEHRSSEQKGPRDDANASYDDVRNSHASYLTVQTHCDSKTQSQCSCQSQTDSSDFTQSFHSHTTSVTDTTDMYAHNYAKFDEEARMTAKDVQGATTTATTVPRNTYDVRVDGGWTKEIKNENYRHDKCSNDNPEYSCASNDTCLCSREPLFGTSYQPNRTYRSSDRSCTNVGSRKTSGGEEALPSTADSVHILPETLVNAASQVGSFAYVTAREMLDKLRAHTKEDPFKRRGGVKNENKKRCADTAVETIFY